MSTHAAAAKRGNAPSMSAGSAADDDRRLFSGDGTVLDLRGLQRASVFPNAPVRVYSPPFSRACSSTTTGCNAHCLTRAPLCTSQESWLHRVEHLDASKNRLEQLPAEFGICFASLVRLDLSRVRTRLCLPAVMQ